MSDRLRESIGGCYGTLVLLRHLFIAVFLLAVSLSVWIHKTHYSKWKWLFFFSFIFFDVITLIAYYFQRNILVGLNSLIKSPY